MSTHLERIATLEALHNEQHNLIAELRSDMKEIHEVVRQINNKLASITNDSAVTSQRVEDTKALTNKLDSLVTKMIVNENERSFALKAGTKVLSYISAIGATCVTLYLNRYAISDFLKRMFS